MEGLCEVIRTRPKVDLGGSEVSSSTVTARLKANGRCSIQGLFGTNTFGEAAGGHQDAPKGRRRGLEVCSRSPQGGLKAKNRAYKTNMVLCALCL